MRQLTDPSVSSHCLATLILLFGFQGQQIVRQPLSIMLLAISIVIQEKMICWPVSPRVDNVKNNDPSLIAPITAVG